MREKPTSVPPPKRHYPDSFAIYDFTSVASTLKASQRSIFQFDYSLLWIRRGEGELFIDSQAYSMTSNVLFCLKPGQQLFFTPAAWGDGFVVCFATEFLDLHETKTTSLVRESLFNHFLLTPVLHLKDDTSPFMHHVTSKMLEEFLSPAAFKKEMLKGLLKVFIIYISRAADYIAHPSDLPRKVALVQQFYLLIERHFASKKLVRDYARLLHVSAGYLNDAVREVSGTSASYHIRQRVIREAKRRIFFHGSSMKEIAFLLGFSDQAHFSKYFKSISGKNFTDFKKEITS